MGSRLTSVATERVYVSPDAGFMPLRVMRLDFRRAKEGQAVSADDPVVLCPVCGQCGIIRAEPGTYGDKMCVHTAKVWHRPAGKSGARKAVFEPGDRCSIPRKES